MSTYLMAFFCIVVNFQGDFWIETLFAMEEQAKMAQSTSTSAMKSLSADFVEVYMFSFDLRYSDNHMISKPRQTVISHVE